MEDSPKNDPKAKPKKRGLGRGLDALFGDEELYDGALGQENAGDGGPSAGSQAAGPRRTLGVDQLMPGSMQPRQYIDHEGIKELADSIAVHGVLQPLLVRPAPGATGLYEIIAGERRGRAAHKAQLHEVPVIIKEIDDATAFEIALIENLQREDLNILEEAKGYKRLIDEFGYTQEKIAQDLGKSRSHVANIIRLLTLPPKLQDMVRQSKITAGHARALVGFERAEELAEEIIRSGLSVRDTEVLVAANSPRSKKKGGGKGSSRPAKDVDTVALENEISGMLGMKVSIDMRSLGSGTLKIEFSSLDQLDEVLHRLSHYPGRQQTG